MPAVKTRKTGETSVQRRPFARDLRRGTFMMRRGGGFVDEAVFSQCVNDSRSSIYACERADGKADDDANGNNRAKDMRPGHFRENGQRRLGSLSAGWRPWNRKTN